MVTTLPYPLNPAKEELDSIVIHKNGRPTPGNKAGNTTIGRDGVGLQIPNRKPGAAPGAPVKKETKPRQRKRVNTAEKRASHNAVERQRRETLNGRFIDLARLLPNLATLRRPSKSSIVNASITHLGHQREQRLLAARELRALFSDLQELLNEVNEWRSRSGLQLRTGVGEWTEGMEEVVSVENEVFGNFLGVGENGDNEGEMAEGEEPEEEDDKAGVNNSNNEPSSATTQQQQTPFSAQFPNHAGLFTPRSSTATSSGDMNFPSAGGYPSYGNNSFSLPGSVDFSGSNTQDSAFLAMQQQQQQGGALNSFLPDSFHGPGGAGNDIDHNSVQSLGQSPTGVSVAGSFGDHVLTPPPPSFAMMEGNGNGMGAGTQVQTYLESPPPSTVAATSFALSNNDGDRVSDWAANQLMLGLSSNGQQHNGMNGVQAQMCFDGSAQYDRRLSNQSTQMFGTPNSNAQNSPSNSGNSKFPVRSNSNGFQYDSSPVTNEFTGNSNSGAQNRLTATHQSLLLSQPQLAAAVFPSSSSSSPPNSSTGFPGHEANEAALQAQAQIVKAAAGLGLSSDQMAEWKRFAMGNFLAERMNKQQQAQAQNKQGGSMAPPRSQQQQQQLPTPTMEELREAVRAGMTVGMGLFQGHQGMNHQWNHGQGVETD